MKIRGPLFYSLSLTFLCGSLFSTQEDLQKFAKQFQSSMDDEHYLNLADESFIKEDFDLASEYYSAFLHKLIPQTFEEEIEASKALWKRALCGHLRNYDEEATRDLLSVINIALEHGYEEEPTNPTEDFHSWVRPINNEIPEPYYYLYPFSEEPADKEENEYMKEGKQYLRNQWKSVKNRAKKAWDYLKDKHRKYREKTPEPE